MARKREGKRVAPVTGREGSIRVRAIFDALDWVNESDAVGQTEDIRESAERFGVPYLALRLVLDVVLTTPYVCIEDIDEWNAAPEVQKITRQWLSEHAKEKAEEAA